MLERPSIGYRAIKRLIDVVGASLALLILSPVMLAAALATFLQDPRAPVLFRQQRAGLGGRPFALLKFRTMVRNADELKEQLRHLSLVAWPDFRLENDPRVTRLGRFLRKTSLDELPQLLNVVRGEMSLVGPRPVVLDELELYGEAEIYYLQVRPGLTGLWQISGRNDVDYERRVSLDAWYVRNWTLWYDILILFRTLLVVPGKRNGAY